MVQERVGRESGEGRERERLLALSRASPPPHHSLFLSHLFPLLFPIIILFPFRQYHDNVDDLPP